MTQKSPQVTTMMSMGASSVFAVDVGAVSPSLQTISQLCRLTGCWSPQVDDTTPRNFGDSVSGWWLLVNKLNPFAGNPNIPAVAEIQSRLA